jgi:hypothetical protein
MVGQALAKPHYRIEDTKNVHLLSERQSSTFNVEELTQFMFGQPGSYYEINARRQIGSVEVTYPFA